MTSFEELNLEYRISKCHPGQWLWPKEDKWAWRWLNTIGHHDLPYQISEHCQSKKLVLQAGGNAGLYPKQYSKIFEKVITFEPDYRNFVCLCENVKESNVTKYQKALGNKHDYISLETNPRWAETNCGALKISGSGNIEQITIDSLNLLPDLIHLDIEGFEGYALMGAEKTIKQSKPLIVLETNGSGDSYGWPQDRIDRMLLDWGYKILLTWDHDTIYKHYEIN